MARWGRQSISPWFDYLTRRLGGIPIAWAFTSLIYVLLLLLLLSSLSLSFFLFASAMVPRLMNNVVLSWWGRLEGPPTESLRPWQTKERKKDGASKRDAHQDQCLSKWWFTLFSFLFTFSFGKRKEERSSHCTMPNLVKVSQQLNQYEPRAKRFLPE